MITNLFIQWSDRFTQMRQFYAILLTTVSLTNGYKHQSIGLKIPKWFNSLTVKRVCTVMCNKVHYLNHRGPIIYSYYNYIIIYSQLIWIILCTECAWEIGLYYQIERVLCILIVQVSLLSCSWFCCFPGKSPVLIQVYPWYFQEISSS